MSTFSCGILSLYCWHEYRVNDGEPLPEGSLEQGVAFIRRHAARKERVLVACGAGMSRAPSFAIAALCEEEGCSLIDAYRDVVWCRRITRPHALWKEDGGVNWS